MAFSLYPSLGLFRGLVIRKVVLQGGPLLHLSGMAESRNSQHLVELLFCVLLLFSRLQLEVEFIPNSSNEDDLVSKLLQGIHINGETHRYAMKGASCYPWHSWDEKME